MYRRTPLALRVWYAILRWFYLSGFIVGDDTELLRLRRWTWHPHLEHQRRLANTWRVAKAAAEAGVRVSLEHRATQLARAMVDSHLSMLRARDEARKAAP